MRNVIFLLGFLFSAIAASMPYQSDGPAGFPMTGEREHDPLVPLIQTSSQIKDQLMADMSHALDRLGAGDQARARQGVEASIASANAYVGD